LFLVKMRLCAKRANYPNFLRELAADFGRDLAVQLHRTKTDSRCNLTNFISVDIDKDADNPNATRRALNDLPGHFGVDVARALRIKIQTNHVSAQLCANTRLWYVGDAADFDLHPIHFMKPRSEVDSRS